MIWRADVFPCTRPALVSRAAYREIVPCRSTRSRALGASRRKRQHRVEPIQGWDGGFLIDAEHGGMRRRPQIQAENFGRFTFELGIAAGQVTLQAMRFQARFFPDPMHSVLADSERGRQLTATPIGWNRCWVPCEFSFARKSSLGSV